MSETQNNATVLNLESVTGRDVSALADPRPVYIIGAHDAGETGFATVIWVTPVSHSPEMIAFALRAKSHTMQMIQRTGVLSASTLPSTDEAIELLEFCGGNTGRMVNKGERVAHELAPVEKADGEITQAPIPAIAYSWITAEVQSIQETGDHLLVVAQVKEAHINAPRDSKKQLVPTETLLCVQHGTYAKGQVL